MTRSLIVGGIDVSSLTVDPISGQVDCSRASGIHHLDFPTPAELCRCCGIELLPSGSRWDIWFCQECHDRVMNLNRAAGAWIIPRGRHSLLHDVMLEPGDLDDAAVAQFMSEATRAFNRMDRLSAWKCEIVRRNCSATGLSADGVTAIPIRRYLAKTRCLSRPAAFDEMRAWWVGAGG